MHSACSVCIMNDSMVVLETREDLNHARLVYLIDNCLAFYHITQVDAMYSENASERLRF